MRKRSLTVRQQRDGYTSSWGVGERVRMVLWRVVWLLLFRPTPKFFRAWRVFLLRLFGARIRGVVFVAASARVRRPWALVMEHRACLADEVEVYNLGLVILRARCTVAQQAYLCGGSHDFSTRRLPLTTGDIEIGADAFIGARAFILPGVTVGEGALVGACSVVTKDVERFQVVAGNPARAVGSRELWE